MCLPWKTSNEFVFCFAFWISPLFTLFIHSCTNLMANFIMHSIYLQRHLWCLRFLQTFSHSPPLCLITFRYVFFCWKNNHFRYLHFRFRISVRERERGREQKSLWPSYFHYLNWKLLEKLDAFLWQSFLTKLYRSKLTFCKVKFAFRMFWIKRAMFN